MIGEMSNLEINVIQMIREDQAKLDALPMNARARVMAAIELRALEQLRRGLEWERTKEHLGIL